MKRIIVAGIYRSGTTALYNIVRLICESEGDTWSEFLNDEIKPEELPELDFQILKAHKYHDKRTPAFIDEHTIVLTTFRENRDILASIYRAKEQMKDFRGQQHDIPKYNEWQQHWNIHSVYQVHFNKLIQNPKRIIRDIARLLKITVNEEEVYQKFVACKPPKEGIDPITLLHAGHITSNIKQTA